MKELIDKMNASCETIKTDAELQSEKGTKRQGQEPVKLP